MCKCLFRDIHFDSEEFNQEAYGNADSNVNANIDGNQKPAHGFARTSISFGGDKRQAANKLDGCTHESNLWTQEANCVHTRQEWCGEECPE